MVIPPDDPRLAPISLRRELIAAGHNDQTLARALRSGVFSRPRTGAYVAGDVWRSATRDQRHALRVRAAYRQSRTEVVVSHGSTLPFHDVPTWGVDLTEIHLTRTDGKTGRREAGIRQHCGRIVDGDTTELYGMTMTTSLRAALEVSATCAVEAAVVVMSYLLHRGDFTQEEIRRRYADQMDRWPYSLTTDLALRLSEPRLESVGEARTWYFFWKHRLPTPTPQFVVQDGAGFVARLDFALPDHGVWFEFDGRVKYTGSLSDGASASDVVIREKQREDMIRELTGWRCFRITWSDLENPERLLRRIQAFLHQGRRAA
jgi:hypothetical protein